MTLKTSFKKFLSVFLCFCISFYFLSFRPVRAHADSATADWAKDLAEGLALNSANAALTYYTSVDPTTLAVCEEALAFGAAVGHDLRDAIEHSEDLPSVTGSSQISVGMCNWTDSNGVTHNAIGSVKCTSSSISFMCSDAGAYAIDTFTSFTNQGYTAANVQSIRIRYQILMGKTWDGYAFTSDYFDTTGAIDSHGTDYKNFDIPVRRGSSISTLTPTSFNVGSFGLGSTGNEYVGVKSGLGPIDVDPDYSSPEALYQSSLDYYNDLIQTYDPSLVDQFWFDFPDPTEQETTEPVSTCCQPFTLPPEWVQSDVVSLDTYHYTVPYTDLMREPFNYLVYGERYTGTAPPEPPTPPSEEVRKATQTKTTTRAVKSGDPVKDLQEYDYEMYEAIFDYGVLIQDIMDRSGVLPYWTVLIAAGALLMII